MNKRANPEELVSSLLNRSICAVQVAACVVDHYGVFSWSWNHSGSDGFGEHAEIHCFRRANRSRLFGATLYVAAQRRRNSKVVTARPCVECQKLVDYYWLDVRYRDGKGVWIKL